MNVYIHETGLLSAAGNNADADFPQFAQQAATDRLLCREPNYAAYIPPMQLRRMSKAVRMGIGAARICLQQAAVERSDAIAVGTAYGCLQDTEVFLSKMVDQQEQMLTPTAFIQSTHNTVAGQIALVTGCHGQNLTYAHKGHSFEHAMIHAQLYLHNEPRHKVLVGGIEELTDTSLSLLQQAKVYRKDAVDANKLFDSYATGSLAGEGATFFLVSRQAQGARLVVKDLKTFYSRDPLEAVDLVKLSITRKKIDLLGLDFVMLGINGDQRQESFYTSLRQDVFASVSQGAFKHLSGEYPVAVAFALGLLTHAARHGLPESVIVNRAPEQFRHLLLVNNFLHHYSVWLLEVL